jgi:hypothetical protein
VSFRRWGVLSRTTALGWQLPWGRRPPGSEGFRIGAGTDLPSRSAVRREAVQASRAQLNQGPRAVWNRWPWGVRECRAERLGPPTWMVTRIRGLAGAEVVFTAARLRGVNPTNHDESRERRGPALSPRPGALSCRRIEPQPTPVDLTPSDGEALMAHATEQIGLALAKSLPCERPRSHPLWMMPGGPAGRRMAAVACRARSPTCPG